jgi:hypothetical protein
MKIFTLSAIALIGAALISGQAAGANFGTLTLKASEIQTVDIGATGRNMQRLLQLRPGCCDDWGQPPP